DENRRLAKHYALTFRTDVNVRNLQEASSTASPLPTTELTPQRQEGLEELPRNLKRIHNSERKPNPFINKKNQ
ncbi:4470_t:CDS:1, partial [Diversispora eburnea]